MPNRAEPDRLANAGGWSTDNFEAFGKLPVLSAIRSAEYELLSARFMAAGRPARALSLGIGLGTIYERLLRDFPETEVCGVDLDPAMLDRCGGSLRNLSVRDDQVVMKQANVAEFDPMSAVQWDVIEATLSLHHVLDSEALLSLFKRCSKNLDPDGIFVLGEIDIEVARFVEATKQRLIEVYGGVVPEIDYQTGEFVTNGDRVPLLDRKSDVMKSILVRSAMPLLVESAQYAPDTWAATADQIAQMVIRCTEFYRSADSWCNLLREAFRKVILITTEELKAKNPDLMDSPVIIVASN
ncbi:class I SAM-dependent methyltransferase [Candidatus Gracilibacteria bacterium]|nr:class I SAM-dependent methyltransferase [Candidatus Gracilibacteria bacterium]